jgi:hypothetical protein
MPESERTTICSQCQKLVGPGLLCPCLEKPVDAATIAALEELRDSLKDHKRPTEYVPGMGLLLLLTLSVLVALVGSFAISMMNGP